VAVVTRVASASAFTYTASAYIFTARACRVIGACCGGIARRRHVINGGALPSLRGGGGHLDARAKISTVSASYQPRKRCPLRRTTATL